MRNLISRSICVVAVLTGLMAADEHRSAQTHDAHTHLPRTGASLPPANVPAKQTVCPVTGKPIDTDIFAEHQGEKVYFCSASCRARFKRSTGEFLPALYRQIFAQRVQINCPVMDEPIDPSLYLMHKGQRIHVCCKPCINKFQKAPDKYLDTYVENVIEQVHCPVSGEAIDPAVFTEHKGKKVYFCCKGCINKFKAEPAKYEAVLRPTAGLIAHGQSAQEDLIVCPLCLSEDAHTRSELQSTEEFNGLTYAFCSKGCAARFKADPPKHAKALRSVVIKTLGVDQAFTCSTHTDVVRAGPGKCPLCETKLETVKRKPPATPLN